MVALLPIVILFVFLFLFLMLLLYADGVVVSHLFPDINNCGNGSHAVMVFVINGGGS